MRLLFFERGFELEGMLVHVSVRKANKYVKADDCEDINTLCLWLITKK